MEILHQHCQTCLEDVPKKHVFLIGKRAVEKINAMRLQQLEDDQLPRMVAKAVDKYRQVNSDRYYETNEQRTR